MYKLTFERMSVLRCLNLLLHLTLCVIRLTSGTLIVKPRNTVVVSGHSATLNCTTNETDSQSSWSFSNVTGNVQPPIYDSGRLNPAYENDKNIRVVTNITAGVYQLQIRSVELGFAGAYTCEDGDSVGDSQSAWIAVLEKAPECSWTSGVVTCTVSVNATSTDSVRVQPRLEFVGDCAVNVTDVKLQNRSSNAELRRFILSATATSPLDCQSVKIIFDSRTTEATFDRSPVEFMVWSPRDSLTTPSTSSSGQGRPDNGTDIHDASRMEGSAITCTRQRPVFMTTAFVTLLLLTLRQ